MTYSLRPTQIAYVLPGAGYKEEDLHSVAEAADEACSDDKLMELAWEVNGYPNKWCSRPICTDLAKLSGCKSTQGE
jgi:hypothetical protein